MNRDDFLRQISEAFQVNPIVAILGPRQCGKTTLAHKFCKNIKTPITFFDLEDPEHLNALKNPKLTLSDLNGLIVFDEIQRRPELFPYLRVLSDYSDKKFLILGSASRELLKQSSESLAGRISYIELTPFNLLETQESKLLWQRGGFPKSYLALSDDISFQWRKNYIMTFLENDIPKMGIEIDISLLRNLWMMVAHYHSNLVNYSDFGRSLNAKDLIIKRYLDVLSNTFMIRLLKPWHQNISKRQVKAPKLYVRDSGILHNLLGLRGSDMLMHPKLGASWEGFAIEEIIRFYKADQFSCYFWATQSGAELDLLLIVEGKKYGFEIKYSDAPTVTKSMKIAIDDLELDELTVIVPGKSNYKIDNNIIVRGLENLIVNS